MPQDSQGGHRRQQGSGPEREIERDHAAIDPAQDCERFRAHEFLMTIPSRMFATCSVASIAASSRSKRSFQRITTIGSIPPSKSEATASRVILSPSFSRRLTSTVFLEM